ncbi:MAG: hypothetical protein P1V51_05695 [Deltaproteobacteria bacterium]|nr:hypothetical protein [Deltaproteobacteria bacterium]
MTSLRRPPLPSLVSLLALALLLGACSSVDLIVRQGPPSDFEVQRIAVAPPVVLARFVEAAAPPGIDAEAPPIDHPVFEAGYYVGHLHMAGGYVVVESERGMQYRSKTIAFNDEARYRGLATEWLERAVDDALIWKRINHLGIEPLPDEAVPLPRKREVRGSRPLDLRDNQNLPAFDLEPGELDEARRAALPDLKGAPLLLIPFLTHYYSHNGGWFVGQTYGTGAGVRLRIFWALYDVSTGRTLRWGEIQGRHIEPYVNSPNSTQIDDYLLEAEAEVSKELRRRLLR